MLIERSQSLNDRKKPKLETNDLDPRGRLRSSSAKESLHVHSVQESDIKNGRTRSKTSSILLGRTKKLDSQSSKISKRGKLPVINSKFNVSKKSRSKFSHFKKSLNFKSQIEIPSIKHQIKISGVHGSNLGMEAKNVKFFGDKLTASEADTSKCAPGRQDRQFYINAQNKAIV
jgi:hypothetical protein